MNKEKNTEINEEKEGNYIAIGMSLGISIGVAIGTAIGFATNNVGVCMCFGVSIGMCIGMAIDSSIKKDDKNNYKLLQSKPMVCVF